MKALCEPIARLANKQDEATGHFWEGRFKALAITDEAGLLAIETEEAGRILRTSTPDQLRKRKVDAKKRRGNSILRDAWLSPLTLNERASTGPQSSGSGVRASDKGFLSLNLSDYLKLLDWTGRQRGSVQKAEIPSDLDPILKRIGIDGRMWCDLVWNFKKYFGRGSAAGSPASMKESASQRNRKFARGQNAASCCFVTS